MNKISFRGLTPENPLKVEDVNRAFKAEVFLETTAPPRKDHRNLTQAEQDAFKAAIDRLVTTGEYRQLALIHSDMSHRMHGVDMHSGDWSVPGLLRFLPWHRSCLKNFEQLLQAADNVLRPGADPLMIPYWRWADDPVFPAWLDGYLPATHPQSGDPLPARAFDSSVPFPTREHVRRIIEDFDSFLPDVPVPYLRFSFALEGWHPEIAAHNHVHDWVGGIMGNPMYSPADPIFWLHHAEIDRIWAIWQKSNPSIHPPLTGADRVMDPWTQTYDDLIDTTTIGYSYESSEY